MSIFAHATDRNMGPQADYFLQCKFNLSSNQHGGMFGTVIGDSIKITTALASAITTDPPLYTFQITVIDHNGAPTWAISSDSPVTTDAGTLLHFAYSPNYGSSQPYITMYIPFPRVIVVDANDFPAGTTTVSFSDLVIAQNQIFSIGFEFMRPDYSSIRFFEVLYLFRIKPNITLLGSLASYYEYTMGNLTYSKLDVIVRNLATNPPTDFVIMSGVAIGSVVSVAVDYLPIIPGITPDATGAHVWFKQAAMTTKYNWSFDRFLGSPAVLYQSWDPSLWPPKDQYKLPTIDNAIIAVGEP